MRSAGVLGLGVAALLTVPAVAAVASTQTGHNSVGRTTMTFSASSGGNATVGKSDRGGGEIATSDGKKHPASSGNLIVTIPKVIFGVGDTLPNKLTAGISYAAEVMVWVTPGVNDASATMLINGAACTTTATPGGIVTHLYCTVSPDRQDEELSVGVAVTSPSHSASRSIAFEHWVSKMSNQNH